ncbi:hypothetical protein BDV38DRAFT_258141 [Aspergillus pseudotamarii]|uniref:Uncharacterized protein n=1 Tax=Aspergillus pseudotamarii TaxID=132259 RepID=A0A5N6SFH5_ASPPS|nr:uncharacterized protein BDV38DRAFT_258141 [Aspergillus pseudotamarii]KAE8133476.1 hypothetical protein BDV38DRAFT_258141 [Aspergillus pseudotamarii]
MLSLSARAIKFMIAMHGDNHGLTIPPGVVKTQVLLVVAQWRRSVEESQNLHVQVESFFFAGSKDADRAMLIGLRNL